MRKHRKADMRRDRGVRVLLSRAGTFQAIGDVLGVTAQAVIQWRRVPVERCLALEHAFGVSRHVLRPDIYGPLPCEAA